MGNYLIIIIVSVNFLLATTAPDGIEQIAAQVLAVDELREPLEGAVVGDLSPFCFLYHAVDSDEQMPQSLLLVFSALLVTETPNEKRNRSTTTTDMRFSPGWEPALLLVSQPGLAIRG